MNAPTSELVSDEIDFMRRVVPLDDARVIELGCGKAELSRRLLQRGLVHSVTALEVDTRQHQANLAAPPTAGLKFLAGGAEEIPLADAQFDLAIMLKSLHHVPLAHLSDAMSEVRRVLVPGGHLYVSEPVYGGEFNELVRLFHDEGVVRAAAYRAIQQAERGGVLAHVGEYVFDTALAFADYDDFVNKMVRVTHSDIALPPAVEDAVRAGFERHMTPRGARFVRQMRINVLRRP